MSHSLPAGLAPGSLSTQLDRCGEQSQFQYLGGAGREGPEASLGRDPVSKNKQLTQDKQEYIQIKSHILGSFKLI